MQLEVIELGKFDRNIKGEDLWSYGGKPQSVPFAIFFVYTPSRSVVVKGMAPNVEAYVKKNFPTCLCYYTFWKGGKSRGWWKFEGIYAYWDRDRLPDGTLNEKSKYFVLRMVVEGKMRTFLKVRRIPRKWLPIYDQADYNIL